MHQAHFSPPEAPSSGCRPQVKGQLTASGASLPREVFREEVGLELGHVGAGDRSLEGEEHFRWEEWLGPRFRVGMGKAEAGSVQGNQEG